MMTQSQRHEACIKAKGMCLDQKGEVFICTLPKGHQGEHLAHGIDNVVLARWQMVPHVIYYRPPALPIFRR